MTRKRQGKKNTEKRKREKKEGKERRERKMGKDGKDGGYPTFVRMNSLLLLFPATSEHKVTKIPAHNFGSLSGLVSTFNKFICKMNEKHHNKCK
jgi:hypothetical protein